MLSATHRAARFALRLCPSALPFGFALRLCPSVVRLFDCVDPAAPNSGAAEHTLNTLRYSDRVKELKGGNAVRYQPSPSQ
eukprot:SAG11_NODE_18627_length_485_cov_1.204663_1_plen_80_part_00